MSTTTPEAVPASAATVDDSVRPRRGAAALWRGRADDAAWVRPSLLGLLALTALLYLWGLGASGWGNSFYSAAVQAGSASWKAFFFGSSDAANSITVDKTPASLWVMALFARIFGVNAWSILVPQALEGVATVGVLYLTVRRWFSPAAALLSGLVLALTPVAVLMFRFNNPDALMVLLLTLGAYAVVRATEKASPKWIAFAGALVGFAFLTKMLQALLVVPAFALVYLVAAPTTVRKRLLHLLGAGAAMVVAAGWWIAIVSLVPASARPYIGGSQHNSILELTLGYNGFGRLTGNETGSVGGGGGGNAGGQWGSTGWGRLFNAEMGGQIAWLLPAALLLLIAGLVITWRSVRTDRIRASFLLWGGWLLTTGLIFSFMKGIIHAYYMVALAPAVAALVGTGAMLLWQRRSDLRASGLLAVLTVGTAIWSSVLLGRSADWYPWLRVAVLVVGIVAALALLTVGRLSRRLVPAVAATAVVVGLGGPTAYAAQTVATPHTGSIVSAGPAVQGAMGGPGGGFGRRGGPGGPGGGQGGPGGPGGQGQPPFGGNAPAMPPGGFGAGQNGPQAGMPTGGNRTGGAPGRTGAGGPGGGMGGLLNGSTASAALVSALTTNADSYTWVAAAVGSNNASGYQLASSEPVMAIGGFNGSDPSPTLAQFKAYVAAKKIHYFIGGGGFGGPSSGGSSSSSAIASWVAANYTSTTIGGTTVYDLTAAPTASSSTTRSGQTT